MENMEKTGFPKRILSAFLAVMMAVAMVGTIQITAPVKAEAASAKKVTVATPKLPQVVRKNSRALKLSFKRVKGAKGYEIQRAMWLGGASGINCGYLDFIAWDLKAVLDAAVAVFETSPVAWAAFQTFRTNVGGILLKSDEE